MRLPVSGLDVGFRVPDGYDDLAIVEAGAGATKSECPAEVLERALDALSRLSKLTSFSAGSYTTPRPETSWFDLSVTDFEVALLGLRRYLFGDVVRCVVRCGCNERMEFDFSISRLLGDVQPRTPARVRRCAARQGWFEICPRPQTQQELNEQHCRARQARFRFPTVSDQILALRSPQPYRFLRQRCIDAPEGARQAPAGVESAMEAMSPAISRPIHGVCVNCGATLKPQLHVPSLVLSDLRAWAAQIHREVHMIAASYHWDESAILALPHLRRQAYSDTIRQAGAR